MNIRKAFILIFLYSIAITSKGTPTDSLNIWTSNLVSLSKVFGYMKYFYPGDEAAKINESKFLMYSIPRVKYAKNSAQLKQILDSLFKPYAPGLEIFSSNEKVTFDKNSLKPASVDGKHEISWQHLGYNWTVNNIYEQMRTFRREKPEKENHAAFYVHLMSDEFAGSHILLRAALKCNSKDSHLVSLWVQSGDKNGKSNVHYAKPDSSSLPSGWRYYSLNMILDSDTKAINLGCSIKTAAKMFIDDICLYKEAPDHKWVKLNLFEGDFEGKNNTGGIGFWLFSGLYQKAVISNLDAATGKQSVLIYKPDSLFEEHSRFGDFIKKSIGNNLSLIMPLALYGDSLHTYPIPDSSAYVNMEKRLGGEMPVVLGMSDPDARIAVAISFWNLMQHFYPYFVDIKVKWEDVLFPLLIEAQRDSDGIELLHTLEKYQALLNDGHAKVQLNGVNSAEAFCPIRLEFVENRIVVSDIYDESVPLERGNIIERINNVSADKYLDSVMIYCSGATKPFRQKKALERIIKGKAGSNLHLSFINEAHEKQEIDISRTLKFNSENFIKYMHLVNADSIKAINDSIYYINISNTKNAEFVRMIPKLAKASSIIIDFRAYPHGIGQGIITHLLTQNDKDVWMHIPRIIRPDHEYSGYSDFGWDLKPEQPHFNGKIIVIVDARAISAAESYIGFFERYKLATIIGQPSAGTNGNVNQTSILGIYTVSWTGMRVTKHNGLQQHGIGICPDIYIERTIKGIVSGKDEFLEKAIQLAK